MQENNNVYFLYNNVALLYNNGPRQDRDRKKRIFLWKNQDYQHVEFLSQFSCSNELVICLVVRLERRNKYV